MSIKREYPIEVVLTVFERNLIIMAVLPKEGDVLTARTVNGLRDKLSLTDEEMVTLAVTNNEETGQRFIPAKSNKYETALSFDEPQFNVIASGLRRLDTSKKLPVYAIDLYDKFVK
jgi:hypothetical protein